MSTETVRAALPHVSSETAEQQIMTRHGVTEIDDNVAATVASWYQSPGTVGHVLAALASGREVSLSDLLDDIAASRPMGVPFTGQALDMLATWAIRQARP